MSTPGSSLGQVTRRSPTSMQTLYLDQTSWDLVLDSSRNIALTSEPYALAQDAASAIRTFLGECWYDTELGVPYWQSVLGKFPPPLALLRAELVAAALTVPNVVSAKVFFNVISQRALTGQVQVTSADGVVSAAGFSNHGRLDTSFVLDQSTLA